MIEIVILNWESRILTRILILDLVAYMVYFPGIWLQLG